MYPTRKILNILLAAACGALLAGGCSVYDRDTCQDGFGSRVMLDLVVPSSSHATKADGTPDGPWSGTYRYEDGDEYDNYIDLDNLQILFYKTDGATYVAKLSDYDIIEITGSGKYETNHAYRINGEMKTAEGKALAAGSYKVMVLANCPKVEDDPETTDVDERNNLANLQLDNFFAEGTYIPMWGMKEMAFKFENGKVDDLGKIFLLRATAKLNVKLNWNSTFKELWGDDVPKFKLKSVELLWGASKVNCLPRVTSLPTVTSIADLTNTEEVLQEGGFNPAGPAAAYSPVKAFTLNSTSTAGSLVVPEFEIGEKPAGVAEDAKAILKIVINDTAYETDQNGNPVLEEEVDENGNPVYETDDQGNQITDPETGQPKKKYKMKLLDRVFYLDPTKNLKSENNNTDGPGKFVRNHSYWFNIVYYADGNLYVMVEVADWINAPELNYEMKMNTNMRLFDSWLYRYDTVDQDYTNWSNWAGSHMVVSEGRVTAATEPVAGRPTRSPQIQLVTTGVTGSSFELTVDNSDFEIIQAVKDNDGKVTDYTPSTNGVLTIPAGDDVYTYFYVVPRAGVTPANPRAIVTLIYNDPVLGPQKVTFNYNSLPGYSDDSSEIWVYYVPAAEYTITGKLKMYYQDSNHPLVPTPVQN